MDHATFEQIWALLRRLSPVPARAPRRSGPAPQYSDALIALVAFWAHAHGRPISWACVRAHWPGVRALPRLPSQSCVSRRLKTRAARALIAAVEAHLRPVPRPLQWVYVVDGTALEVARHSRDPHARCGRGVSGLARGYKLHVLLAAGQGIIAWKLAPLHVDERPMALRLLREAQCAGYILGDGLYDSRHLYEEAARHGGQFIAPRRLPFTPLGRRKQAPARVRALELLERAQGGFGRALYAQRRAVEREFGRLKSAAGLLRPRLDSWVRTYHRVRQYVTIKLALAHLQQARQRARAVA